METISFKKQSSISFEESSWETRIDSDMVSVHWQPSLRTTALLDFAIVFPVSTYTIETTNLSHPLGTWTTNIIRQLQVSFKHSLLNWKV